MYVAEVVFEQKQMNDTENVMAIIDRLLGALRMNGQIMGREFSIARDAEKYSTYLLIPEQNSLDKSRANVYVAELYNKLDELEIDYSWKIVGDEPYSKSVCKCGNSNFYILYTTYISLESPIRCGDCFGVVPLYQVPAASSGEYADIRTWESDYKACDTLQMNCSTGEHFGILQLSRYESGLSKRGIDICNRISASTGTPTYYYLLKATGQGKKAEENRKCPSCGAEWLLHESLHEVFDFRCDHCRLLSNIAWSVRSKG